MGRWDATLGYLKDDRPGLHRIGRLFIIALVTMLVAIGMSFALGDDDHAEPVLDNSTGRYAEGPTNWGLCVTFVVMGVVLLAAVLIEIRT